MHVNTGQCIHLSSFLCCLGGRFSCTVYGPGIFICFSVSHLLTATFHPVDLPCASWNRLLFTVCASFQPLCYFSLLPFLLRDLCSYKVQFRFFSVTLPSALSCPDQTKSHFSLDLTSHVCEAAMYVKQHEGVKCTLSLLTDASVCPLFPWCPEVDRMYPLDGCCGTYKRPDSESLSV